MLTTHPFDDDKLREECGVFGVYGAEGAAAMTALGLHALQHRGQEAAGITTFDGKDFHSHRAQGHVAGNFDREDIIVRLPGDNAVGHVRYSTTGETALRNVQPLYAELVSGGFAVAHNGNISNATKLRRELVRRGSIFQSTSDTETIIHLVATSTYRTLLDRFIDALKQLEGAYSLICLTPEGMLACRDPLGIRPLVLEEDKDAHETTRDWKLVEHDCGTLTVVGGKITTYRRLAEAVLTKAAPKTKAWTKSAPLPGGDVPRRRGETGQLAFARWLRELIARHPDHDPALVTRLARTHGTAAESLLSQPLGENFGGLFEAELRRFATQEWARTGDDVLWRRTKMGLHLDAAARARVTAWMAAFTRS